MNKFYFRKESPKWRAVLVALCIFFMHCGCGFAQSLTVQVGTGTATSDNIPLNAYYGYSYSQQIYTAAELNAAGVLSNSMIRKIRFYRVSGSSVTNNSSWTVYVGNSSKSMFSTNTDWEPVSNLTSVFSGDVSFPAAGNWMEITLTTPVAWNGYDHLIVAVHEKTPGYSSSAVSWQTTVTTDNRSIYYRMDSNSPNPAAPPTATGRLLAVNNIQFDFQQTPCSGVPEPGAAIARNPKFCAGGSSLISLQNNYTNNSGISYQWQSSLNGIVYTDINQATSPSYLATPPATTWYRARLTCESNTGFSAPVLVTVQALPSVTVDHTNLVYCSGSPAELTASGASTYQWSPETGLNVNTGAMVQATPPTTQLYTVTGTDGDGCQNTATVKVTNMTSFVPLVGTSTPVNCSENTPVLATVNNAPTNGGLEYQLTDTSGYVVRGWQSSTNFSFIPAHSGNLKYQVQARRSDCAQNSLLGGLDVYYGFVAEVTKSSSCLESGATNKIVVTNPGGANLTLTNSQYSFDTSTLPEGTTLHGTASVTGQRMVITPSATSNRGGFTISDLGAGSPHAVELSFLMTADQPINNFGTGGADGMAWSFGDDANFSTQVTNGAGSKLRLVFDAASNGSENGNVTGIYLTYGYTSNTQMGPSSTGVLAYSNNMSWKLQTDKLVKIVIDSDGKLTATYDDNVIFDHIQLPPAYTQADKSQWRHLFTAFTGGDALRFAIDDLKIKYTRQDFMYGITRGSSTQPPTVWQTSPMFENLETSGLFNVWMGSASDAANCNKNLGSYPFTYPVADSTASATLTQSQNTELIYTNDHCEIIALISSDLGSLNEVTMEVHVLDSTMAHGGQPYIGRYFDISAANNVGGTVTLYFTDAEISDYNARVASLNNPLFPAIGSSGEHLQITAYHNTVGSGTGPHGYNLEGAEVIIPSSVKHNIAGGFWEVKFQTTSFSGFFAHTNSKQNPLPVVLRNISATNQGATNRIVWHTEKEDAGDQFSLERSGNGKQFAPIAQLAALGVAGSDYSFIDTKPLPHLNYYRLRILNNDGTSFLSRIVYARPNPDQLVMTTFPNPVENELSVQLADSEQEGILILTDVNGRLIERKELSGSNYARFSMKHLASGIYLLTYEWAGARKTLKVIKY